MVKLSKVNLFLHGFPDPAIHIYDTLSNDARWHEKADIILANPPFMTPKGGVTPHTKFRIAAKKAEVEEQRRIVAEIEGYQKEIGRLESEIATNRERIQASIDAVWSSDSDSANGAPPTQPGATPQVKGRKQNEG